MKKFLPVIVLLVLVFGGMYAYDTFTEDTDSVLDVEPGDTSALIVVTNPSSGALITSPVAVSGEARGSWYFEGSFPVTVVAADGTLLGEGIATAQGEWMSEKFVPFTGTITFTAPVGDVKSGTIVFQKDNPSGLPENNNSVSVPIQFQ